MTTRRRSKYSEEFKKEAVAKLISGVTRKDLAKELGVSTATLTEWKQQSIKVVAKRKKSVVVKSDKPEEKVTRSQDAIIWLKKAKKVMQQRGLVAFDDPVCQFAILALNTLEGKM